jgi:hypothetical protein
MSDEKHHSTAHPDYNLDALDGIPGEVPLEKDRAWEKLYLRLHENNRIKKRYRYWIAAACMLSALFFFGISGLHREKLTLLTHIKNKPPASPGILREHPVKIYPPDKQGSVVKNPDRKKEDNPRSSAGPAKIKIPGQSLDQTEGTAGVRLNARPRVYPAININERGPDRLRPDQSIEIQPESGAVSGNPAIADAKPNILKKKLRVVHLNELDESPASDGSLAKNSGRPRIRLKWNEPIAATGNIAENIYSNNTFVKIRLSSPN